MERHFFAQQRFYEISVFYLYWHMYVGHFDTFLNLFSVGFGTTSVFCKLNRKVETKVSKGLNNGDDIFSKTLTVADF
jgi:hypothetical protein